MLWSRNKNKIAKLLSIDMPAGYLAPRGRAVQQVHVEEAHVCGEFLASVGSGIVCQPPRGEVANALINGALARGGKVTVFKGEDASGVAIPEGVDVTKTAANSDKKVLENIGHIWLMPPAFSDLDYYLETWINSGFKPLVCLSPRDEFRLLRGFVQEVVCVGNPKISKRLIFSPTPQEGWEKLSDLLA